MTPREETPPVDPIVESIRSVEGLPGKLHIHLSCGHTLLRYGWDYTWSLGHPHHCDACILEESTIREVAIGVGGALCLLTCPRGATHHVQTVPLSRGLTPENAREVLKGTTVRCSICHR